MQAHVFWVFALKMKIKIPFQKELRKSESRMKSRAKMLLRS